MSSENYVGIIMAESLRFPGEGSSAQGKPELLEAPFDGSAPAEEPAAEDVPIEA